MELGDYIDKVDAIVYIGLPDGQGSGAKAIAEILTDRLILLAVCKTSMRVIQNHLHDDEFWSYRICQQR